MSQNDMDKNSHTSVTQKSTPPKKPGKPKCPSTE